MISAALILVSFPWTVQGAANAPFNKRTKNGSTAPLHHACTTGAIENMTKILLETIVCHTDGSDFVGRALMLPSGEVAKKLISYF